MSGLELALVILIGIWTVIFAIIAVAVLIVFLSIRRALKKANQILDTTEAMAQKVDLPSKVVIASILGFMAKQSFSSLKGLIASTLFKRNKRSKA